MNARDDLVNRFDYHKPPDKESADRHERIRVVCHAAASQISREVLEGVEDRGGRELAVAVRKIEEAMFWANAALARNWPVDGAPTVVADSSGSIRCPNCEVVVRWSAEHRKPDGSTWTCPAKKG